MTRQSNQPQIQAEVASKKQKIVKLTKYLKQKRNLISTQEQSLSKDEIKKIRNRQHAQNSRDKKQIYLLNLELQISNLKNQINQLKNSKQTYCANCRIELDRDIPLELIQTENEQKNQNNLEFFERERLAYSNSLYFLVLMVCICAIMGFNRIQPQINLRSNQQFFVKSWNSQTNGQIKVQQVHGHQQLTQFPLVNEQMVAFTSTSTVQQKSARRKFRQGYPSVNIKDIKIQRATLGIKNANIIGSSNINILEYNTNSKTNQTLEQSQNKLPYNNDVLFCKQPILYRYSDLKNSSFINGKLLLMLGGLQLKQIPMNQQGINLSYQQHENIYEILADVSSVKVLNKSLCNGQIK